MTRLRSRRMVSRGGRPPGRELTELEQQHIRLLHELRERAGGRKHDYDTRLEDFALLLRDSGCSNSRIAKVIGVSPSAVQTWVRNAEARRDT